MTIKSMIKNLEVSLETCTGLRARLETVQQNTVELKGTVSAMVATASTKLNAEMSKAASERDNAYKLAEENTGCFNSVGNGILTIISLGTYCLHLDSVMKKANKNAEQLEVSRAHLENSVQPLVKKLDGLNGVTEDLLVEAMGNRSVVKNFETELNSKILVFKQRQSDVFGLKLEPLRQKLMRDFTDLIAKCNVTMRNSQTETESFRSILVDITKQERSNALMSLYMMPPDLNGCPRSPDPYCGYSNFDGECVMWC